MSSAETITDAPAKERPLPIPPAITPERTLSVGQWGMLCFLVSEMGLFGTLIVTYVFYIGKSVVGPYPVEVLSLPLVLVTTACLLSSSVTIHLAESRLHGGNRPGFLLWWAATILLGAVFLAGTAWEWRELIFHHHLTIGRNLFGTTFYTLVGLHGLHVTGGLLLLLLVLGMALRFPVTPERWPAVGLISWYWHFVDVVWVVVFLVVYVFGR